MIAVVAGRPMKRKVLFANYTVENQRKLPKYPHEPRQNKIIEIKKQTRIARQLLKDGKKNIYIFFICLALSLYVMPFKPSSSIFERQLFEDNQCKINI